MQENDFLSQLSERAANSKAEWEKIDGLINILKTRNLSQENKMLFKLVTMLAEQIRPVGSDQDLKEITQDIDSMLSKMVDQMKKSTK